MSLGLLLKQVPGFPVLLACSQTTVAHAHACTHAQTHTCICVYACVCMNIRACVCVSVCMCMYLCLCACLCGCVCVYMCLYVHVCTCVYTCVYMCARVCVLVCIHVCACVRTCMCMYMCACISVIEPYSCSSDCHVSIKTLLDKPPSWQGCHSSSFSFQVYALVHAAGTECHRLGGIQTQELTSHCSGGWEGQERGASTLDVC